VVLQIVVIYQQTHEEFYEPGLLLLFSFRCVALLYVHIAIQHN